MLATQPGAQIKSAAKSAWKHLDEKTVMFRIDDLKQHPNWIQQGALGLCGEAAFYHHVLQRRPLLFGAMAKLLFMDGIGFIGDLVIKPDDDLLLANYGQIVTNWNNTKKPGDPDMPRQADWMVLSALRDTENEFLDFQGAPDEKKADSSDIAERFWWYKKSGLYSNVVLDEETDLVHVMSHVVKSDKNHIALRIAASMLQPTTGRHVIALESPLALDINQGTMSFRYWSWGHSIQSLTIAIPHFANTYLGAVIATF